MFSIGARLRSNVSRSGRGVKALLQGKVEVEGQSWAGSSSVIVPYRIYRLGLDTMATASLARLRARFSRDVAIHGKRLRQFKSYTALAQSQLQSSSSVSFQSTVRLRRQESLQEGPNPNTYGNNDGTHGDHIRQSQSRWTSAPKSELGSLQAIENVAYTFPQKIQNTVLTTDSAHAAEVVPTSRKMQLPDTFASSRNERELYHYYLPLYYRLENKVSRYEMGNKIGSGFFADVYAAVDRNTGEQVAIKSIEKSKCPKELFQQELKIMQELRKKLCNRDLLHSSPSFTTALDHLAVAKDVFETSEKLCFVFDICKGGDLFDYVAANKKLNEDQAKTILRDLACGLEKMHTAGIIHRDVKLENILLENPDDITSIKLTDFGYAKQIDEKDLFRNPAGTFGYVAPEILQSRTYSDKCDIWSTGVVLFTLLAGHPPFPYQSQLKTSSSNKIPHQTDMLKLELEAILTGREESVWNAEMAKPEFALLSTQAKNILSKLLEVDPEKRPSASAILLDPWLTNRDNPQIGYQNEHPFVSILNIPKAL